MKATPPDIQLLTSPEELYALGAEWNPLLEQSATRSVFMTWEWIWSWWKAFGAGLQPWILTVREPSSNRLMGIAPFVLARSPFHGGPYRELSLLGAGTMAGDHLDVIARSGCEAITAATIAGFLRAHCHQWDVLALDRITADSALAGLLLRENRRPAMVWGSVCPFLRLPDRWDDLLPLLDKNLRRKLRSSASRLHNDSMGEVEYRAVCHPDELPAAMADLVRMHQAVRGAHRERGAFRDQAARRFLLHVAERFLEKGWLRFYLLKARGCTIAAHYCLRYDDKVSFFVTGYDRTWAQYRPGLLILAHAMRTSIEEGAREYDLLRGIEPYKLDWTRTARRDIRLRLAGNPAGSLLVLGYRNWYAARKKFRRWKGRVEDEKGIAIDNSRLSAHSGEQ